MTINKKIIDALAFSTFPVYPNVHNDMKNPYFVFGYSVVPSIHGDDAPQFVTFLCWVNFYCSHNFDSVEIVKDIKNSIEKSGFTAPIVVLDTDEHMQGWRFEFEDLGGANTWQV